MIHVNIHNVLWIWIKQNPILPFNQDVQKSKSKFEKQLQADSNGTVLTC